MSEKNYRVRSLIKSFRDLEVYQKTVMLSSEITSLPFLKEKGFEDVRGEIRLAAEKVPSLIAEAYGDRFDSEELAHKKVTEAMTLVVDIIVKVDLLRERFSEDKEVKEALDSLLIKYQTQRGKLLNLRKAWERVFSKSENVPKNE